MSFKLPEKYRDNNYPYCDMGGLFRFPVKNGFRALRVVATIGSGWEHTSVTLDKKIICSKTPNWYEMCFVKNMFWDDEDIVWQYHLPADDNVNIHPGCLHLWRKQNFDMPLPIKIMV